MSEPEKPVPLTVNEIQQLLKTITDEYTKQTEIAAKLEKEKEITDKKLFDLSHQKTLYTELLDKTKKEAESKLTLEQKFRVKIDELCKKELDGYNAIANSLTSARDEIDKMPPGTAKDEREQYFKLGQDDLDKALIVLTKARQAAREKLEKPRQVSTQSWGSRLLGAVIGFGSSPNQDTKHSPADTKGKILERIRVMTDEELKDLLLAMYPGVYDGATISPLILDEYRNGVAVLNVHAPGNNPELVRFRKFVASLDNQDTKTTTKAPTPAKTSSPTPAKTSSPTPASGSTSASTGSMSVADALNTFVGKRTTDRNQ